MCELMQLVVALHPRLEPGSYTLFTHARNKPKISGLAQKSSLEQRNYSWLLPLAQKSRANSVLSVYQVSFLTPAQESLGV